MKVSKRTELIVIKEPGDEDITEDQFRIALESLAPDDTFWYKNHQIFQELGVVWIDDHAQTFETLTIPDETRYVKLWEKGAYKTCACGSNKFVRREGDDLFDCLNCGRSVKRV